MKNVRGLPAYWQDQLYDVLAMLQTLHIPTWFLTLSAADLHWPEIYSSSSCTVWEEIITKRCPENEHCTQKQILVPKPHNRCVNVSTQS